MSWIIKHSVLSERLYSFLVCGEFINGFDVVAADASVYVRHGSDQ